MNLLLRREQYGATGIFSALYDDLARQIAVTIEHAYLDNDAYRPKIPAGVYTCVRGLHTLEHHPEPFETFEITGVPGHSKLLFHWGNWQDDSDGCVLLGVLRTGNMIIDSRLAFAKIMSLQKGLDSFQLRVEA